MPYAWLADLTVIAHLIFVGFVVCGGLLVWRWGWVLWVHVPAVVWAIGVECLGGVCPLTHLENWLRTRAGAPAYRGDFIDTYLMPVLYPVGLTRTSQVVLSCIVLLVNTGAYVVLWRHRRL